MSDEDASQIDFGMGFPKECNQTMAYIAEKFQTALRPVVDLREASKTAFDAVVKDSKMRNDAN